MLAGGHTVKMLEERDPAQLPWKELDVDVVVESTVPDAALDNIRRWGEFGAHVVVGTSGVSAADVERAPSREAAAGLGWAVVRSRSWFIRSPLPVG